MKNLLIAVCLGFVVLITCCKKEEAVFSGAKVLATTHLLGGLVDAYNYNADGTVALITHSNGDKTVFTYTGDSILMEYLNSGIVVSSATEYLLRGQKYADTSYGLYQAQNNAAKYSYNGDGQLTQLKSYSLGSLSSTTDFSITDKNVLNTTNTNAATSAVTHTYYAYNTNTNTVGNQNFGMGFLGVGTVYLPTIKVQLGQNGDTTAITTYKYHYNSSAYVDTLVMCDRTGHVLDSLAYSY